MMRIAKKIMLILSLCLFVLGLGSPVLSHAAAKRGAKITVVSGVIQNDPGDDIVVKDRRYTIKGVRVLLLSGRPAAAGDLKRGNVADIYFENGTIIKVLIHEPLLS